MTAEANETPAPSELRSSPLFGGLDDDELDAVASFAAVVQHPAGTTLIDQGRVGRECFVLLEGTASVYVGDDYVASVGPGAAVGEMALLGHQPRTATVITNTPVRAAAFDAEGFRQLLDDVPQVDIRFEELFRARAGEVEAARESQRERRS